MTEPYEVHHPTREAARALATTTKTIVHTTHITPRWLLRLLPWVQVAGGTYRVNRRKLMTAHFFAAVLTEDALGILKDVEVGS